MLKAQPQRAHVSQKEIASLKRDLNEAVSDASNAARQTQEQSVLRPKIKKSDKAWQMEALASCCALCEVDIPKGDLLMCTPAAPASTLMLCPICSQM